MFQQLFADPNAIIRASVFAVVAFGVFSIGGTLMRKRPRVIVADEPEPVEDSAPAEVAPTKRKTSTAAPVVTERRQTAARDRRWLKVVLAEEDLEDQCVDAWLTDCSSKGIGLLMFQEVNEGRVLRVRPATAAGTMPWTRVEARFCRHLEKNTWSAGCMFLEKPQWSAVLTAN